jgi:DNA mismatch repair protein MutL
MELRFGNSQEIYRELVETLYGVLSHRELIPEVPVEEKQDKKLPPVYREPIPEPFEKRRINQVRGTYQPDTDTEPAVRENASYHVPPLTQPETKSHPGVFVIGEHRSTASGSTHAAEPEATGASAGETTVVEQVTLESMSPEFLTPDARKKHRIIGQLFATYWLIEYEDKLYIIDQHAAHEKVLYERTMAQLQEKEFTSQSISPPIMLSLDAREQEMLETYLPQIERLGYVVEPFGGREYMISAVPDNLFSIDSKDLFLEMLDDFANLNGKQTPELILEKVASMSCKAAVKGNNTLSLAEIDALIGELLTLENPFNCPHGRPTIISMSKYEIEKKFKRVVS